MPLVLSGQLGKLVYVNGDNHPEPAMVSNQYAIEVFLNLSGSQVATTPTNTALTASATTTAFGQSVTFTATVTPQSGTGVPTGTVTFFDGATPLGSAGLQNSGTTSTLQTSTLAVGAHSITATYSGDANFATSTSTAVVVTVSQGPPKASTTTVVTASPNPATFGANVTLTATVTSATAGAISGTVTFSGGGGVLGGGGGVR